MSVSLSIEEDKLLLDVVTLELFAVLSVSALEELSLFSVGTDDESLDVLLLELFAVAELPSGADDIVGTDTPDGLFEQAESVNAIVTVVMILHSFFISFLLENRSYLCLFQRSPERS